MKYVAYQNDFLCYFTLLFYRHIYVSIFHGWCFCLIYKGTPQWRLLLDTFSVWPNYNCSSAKWQWYLLAFSFCGNISLQVKLCLVFVGKITFTLLRILNLYPCNWKYYFLMRPFTFILRSYETELWNLFLQLTYLMVKNIINRCGMYV